jgi:hypothetical protein
LEKAFQEDFRMSQLTHEGQVAATTMKQRKHHISTLARLEESGQCFSIDQDATASGHIPAILG